MTIEKQKLKELAEAANAITTDVNITMAIGADPVEVKAVQDYLQVAMPKTILALLAEIERLEASDSESTELCDCLSSLLGQVAVTVRGPEEPKSRHGFSDIPSRVKVVVAERDQLKAENELIRALIGDAATNLRKASAWVCREVEAGTRSATHWAVRLRERADRLDAAMAKEVSHG